MDYVIRDEQAKDVENVRAILGAAFPGNSESELVDLLRTNGKAIISLVAVNGDDVLGYILFSPVSILPPSGTTPPSDARGIGLAPVAVRPDAQSLGIGSRLIQEGLIRCKELGFQYCVVLGDPNYYQRFGFEKASQFNVQNEYGVDDEFMIVRFTPRSLNGLVRYSTEFAEVGV